MAIARILPPCSLTKASLSLRSSQWCSVTLPSNPFMKTGFLLPTRRTSGIAPAIGQTPLHEEGDRLLDQRLEGGKQFGAERAVEHAMIARHGRRHLADEFDGAVLRLHRRAARRADRQDRRVRRIDDGGELARAVHAEIGDGGG